MTTINFIGTVKNKIYENDDITKPYKIFSVITKDLQQNTEFRGKKDIIIHTNVPILINKKEKLEITGQIKYNDRYGYFVYATEIKTNESITSNQIKKFLKNLLSDNITKELIKTFGDNTLEEIIYRNQKAIDIIIGKRKKMNKFENVYKKICEHINYDELLNYMIVCNLTHLTNIIWENYKDPSLTYIKEQPCKLYKILNFEDLEKLNKNFNYKTIELDKAKTLIFLKNIVKEGNTCVKKDVFEDFLNSNCGTKTKILYEELKEEIIFKKIYNDTYVYLKDILRLEENVLIRLKEIREENKKIDKKEKNDIDLDIDIDTKIDTQQKNALMNMLKYKFCLITGSAGTGKTTIIKTFINLNKDKDILLLAPTGKAAKRMEEATGMEAKTIHRALGIKKDVLNEDLEEIIADFVIIDESSMINLLTFCKLLNNINPKTQIIMIGDNNQLRSIGLGNIFVDLINSKKFPVTVLNTIHRTSQKSNIYKNANKILQNNTDLEFGEDFIFLKNTIDKVIEKSYNTLLKKYGEKSEDIQILCGTNTESEIINRNIQELFNSNKKVFLDNDIVYKVGDKVIQVINNYVLEVFNGEIGYITEIKKENNEELELTVDFGDKIKKYNKKNYTELKLAYAITVHKAQGSEFKNLIFILSEDDEVINNRNFLYTGITRAKKRCILIGEMNYIKKIINKIPKEKQTNITSSI